MTLEQIITSLREYLRRQRYIIVLDDVWEHQPWECIKVALPFHNYHYTGSRIVITTRSEDVTLAVTPSSDFHLLPLPHDAAYLLFCMRTFGERNCPLELMDLSHEIVAKCEGLPLAIVTIAKLLATTRYNVLEWYKLYKWLALELASNAQFRSSTRVLLLSYYELPHYLKPCFLYFGMFPEDYSIEGNKLVRLWIAEGFVKSRPGRTLEEVAEEYLTALTQRSLVQVSVKDDSEIRSCFQVHDIWHGLILSIIKDLGFSQVLLNGDSSLVNGQFRRLSIHESYTIECVSRVIRSMSRICTLLSFSQRLNDRLAASMLKATPHLRVLDLQGASITTIPFNVIGNLPLRYLSFRKASLRVKYLDESIAQFHNLETLDLKWCELYSLPREMNRLQKLRHFVVGSFIASIAPAIHIKEPILRNMEELQTLKYVKGITAHIPNLLHLKKLRKLGIVMERSENGAALCHTVEKMEHLRSFKIRSEYKDDILDLKHIVSPPPMLQNLYLGGRLEEWPDWVMKLSNLIKLSLVYSRLTIDPLLYLQHLNNLAVLKLDNAYDGQSLEFGTIGFQKLKVLHINELHSLEVIGGGLPALQKAYVYGCPNLKEAPIHLLHLFLPDKASSPTTDTDSQSPSAVFTGLKCFLKCRKRLFLLCSSPYGGWIGTICFLLFLCLSYFIIYWR